MQLSRIMHKCALSRKEISLQARVMNPTMRDANGRRIKCP
jgi:hypothetical protein